MARRRTCSRRSTPRADNCRRTCRTRRPIARSTRPTRRSWCLAVTSDTLPLTEVDDYAENILVQKISPDIRRRPGRHRRPAEAGRPRPGRSGEAGRRGIIARGRAHACSARPTSICPKGTLNGPRQTFTLTTNDQLLKPATMERRHHRLSQRRAGAHPRHRPRHQTRARRRSTRRLVRTASGRSCWRSISSPAPTSSRRSDRIKATLPQLEASIPPAVKMSGHVRPHQTIRASVADVQFTLLLTVALVVMVIFLFLRNFWATVIPERHRAAGAGRHLRGDVRARLQPRQSVADGADDRGRLRGRRRDRR